MAFKAMFKSYSMGGSAALNMVITGNPCHDIISYDYMYGRNITGSNDWKELRAVLDVSKESHIIELSITASGAGKFWVSAVAFEETKDEPTGNRMFEDEPCNLDFSEW
jgi:hypothetical protein